MKIEAVLSAALKGLTDNLDDVSVAYRRDEVNWTALSMGDNDISTVSYADVDIADRSFTVTVEEN